MGTGGWVRTSDKGELDAAEDGVEVEVGEVEGGLEAVDVDVEGLGLVRGHCGAASGVSRLSMVRGDSTSEMEVWDMS